MGLMCLRGRESDGVEGRVMDVEAHRFMVTDVGADSRDGRLSLSDGNGMLSVDVGDDVVTGVDDCRRRDGKDPVHIYRRSAASNSRKSPGSAGVRQTRCQQKHISQTDIS